jgi:hypothetical protein
MTDQTILRDAGRLTPGDRIEASFLPMRREADVLFLAPDINGFVLVAYRYDDGRVAADHWLDDGQIPLVSTADALGFAYTRADSDADDPTPVSPARVPLHTGSVVDGGVLVTDGGE